jgi:hypothetical protein
MSLPGSLRRCRRFACGPLAAVASVVALALVGQAAGLWAALPRQAALPRFAEYAGGDAQSFSPFNAPLVRSIAPHAAAAFLLLILAARLAGAFAESGRWRRGRGAGAPGPESGASVIEFALVLPLLLTILLLVFQIALLVQAKFVVNYAAFCATRSAIVTIPAKIYSTQTRRYEKSNTLQLNSPASPKMNIIRRAAALPVTAISPPFSPELWVHTGAPLPNRAYLAPLLMVAGLFPFSTPEGKYVSGELPLRAGYAYDRDNTSVAVSIAGGGGGGGGEPVVENGQIVQSGQRRDFADHALVTARVTYRYYLTVPVAGRLLGTPYRGGWLGYLTGTGWYYPVTEQYTLPLEGEPEFPPDQEPHDRSLIETEIYD